MLSLSCSAPEVNVEGPSFSKANVVLIVSSSLDSSKEIRSGTRPQHCRGFYVKDGRVACKGFPLYTSDFQSEETNIIRWRQVGWNTHVIPALGRWRQEDLEFSHPLLHSEFEESLGYIKLSQTHTKNRGWRYLYNFSNTDV